MNIRELRAELGMSLEAFANAVGLKSKGQMLMIERGLKPSVRVALGIEKLSGGRIKASSLNEAVALVEAARSEAA